jgi:alpha-galactosidase
MPLADRPPMGWNSWNCFLGADERADFASLTADAILGCAQALVDSGMHEAGYEYVVLDDGWQAASRDSTGRLAAHPARFP